MYTNHIIYQLISVICFILWAILVLGATEEELIAWNQFKSLYNKSYSCEEDERRLQIFLDNKRFIESHNTKAQANFKQGINPLSDLTADEINSSRNGFRLNISLLLPETQPGLLEHLLERAWYDEMITQPKLDYRDTGRVSKVKDQGSCGSCWAFATTGAIESILAARNKGILLSEQNLVDCSQKYGNNGCNGGLMDAALRYVRDYGIMSSRDYPYKAEDGTCRARQDRIVTKVRGSMMLPPGNEPLLRIVLALTGPLPVAIDASARSFHSYKSGVYDDRVCGSSSRHLNHAVLLVGYGTDKSGLDYWILKNSWSRSWGENGYIRLARNRGNMCGIATYAILPIP